MMRVHGVGIEAVLASKGRLAGLPFNMVERDTRAIDLGVRGTDLDRVTNRLNAERT